MALYSVLNFLFYIPLYMLTKMSAKGLFPSQHGVGITGFEILPLYSFGALIANILFLKMSGWIKLVKIKKIFGVPFPAIRWYIYVSGLATIGQIITAIWAYAFNGISIVFATLLMKGGMLIIAPVVDLAVKKRRRRIYWPSWVAACLSLFALFVAFLERADTRMTLVCVLDILLYLTAIFTKLTVMSRYAKTHNNTERKEYLAAEQLVVCFGSILILFTAGVAGRLFGIAGPLMELWNGFTAVPQSGFIIEPMLIGVSALAGGICMTMILLDRRENTFCIAASQAASVFAGTVTTILLSVFFGEPPIGIFKIISVAIVTGAIFFLAYHSRVVKISQEM